MLDSEDRILAVRPVNVSPLCFAHWPVPAGIGAGSATSWQVASWIMTCVGC